jgi:hypothetical protein
MIPIFIGLSAARAALEPDEKFKVANAAHAVSSKIKSRRREKVFMTGCSVVRLSSHSSHAHSNGRATVGRTIHRICAQQSPEILFYNSELLYYDNFMMRLNTIIATTCLVLAVVLPATVLYWLFSNPEGNVGLHLPSGAPLWARAIMVIAGATPVSCMAVALLHARRCFLSFSRGDYFTMPVVKGLRGFAAGLFFSGIAAILIIPLASLLQSMASTGAPHSVSIGLGSTQILTILFAGILWQIAAVMSKARALAQENAQFV